MSQHPSDPLPGDALVVRGGTNTPKLVEKGRATHPCGVSGVSVECADGVTLEQLCKSKAIPHGQVGVTRVRDVRALGGDVIRTDGKSPNHATLTGLTADEISGLFNPTVPNPARGTG